MAAVPFQDQAVIKVLQRMERVLRGRMRPVLQAMGSALEQNAQLRFDLKEAPDGSPWKEWSSETAAARAAEGRGTLLEYTGRMRDSLTFFADNKTLVVGFGVDYARFVDKKRPLLLDGEKLGRQDREDGLRAAVKAFKKILQEQGAS